MQRIPALAGALAVALSVPALALANHKRPLPRWWLAQAACVRSHEGSWRTNTGNGYFGAYQMDLGFQKHYGRWAFRHYGTADRWPARVQSRVAYRGWRERGWRPWPTSASLCGLR
jgi:hypothetical protein